MTTQLLKNPELLALSYLTPTNPRGDVVVDERGGAARGRARASPARAAGKEGRGSVSSVNDEPDSSAAQDDWDEPTWPGPSSPPPLPTAGLPDWIQDHVESVAGFTQTPPAMAVMFSLAGLSTALSNKGVVKIRSGWTEPLTLWTMTILEPANRKSAVLKLMLEPIWEYERERVEAVADARERALQQREALKKVLKNKRKEKVRALATDEDTAEIQEQIRRLREELDNLPVPAPERLIVDDVTPEALLQFMAQNHGRVAVLSAEGEIFRYMGGRYIDTPMLNAFKKAWTGDEHIRDDRVTRRGSQISSPALTMGLGLQPELLRSLGQKESFRGEGIFGRFLAIQPRSPAGDRKTGDEVPPLNEAACARYERNLRTLLESGPADEEGREWVPHTLSLSDDASERLADFEAEIERRLRKDLDTLKDWAGKLVGNTARMAGLLHVAGQAEEGDLWARPVSSDAVAAAIELSRQLIPHAKTVFSEMNLDPEVRRERYVLRRIEEAEDIDELTVRDVHRLCSGKKWVETVTDVEDVLERLDDHNLVQIEPRASSNGRKPSPWIRLHPELREEIDRTDRTPLASPAHSEGTER